MSRRYTFLLIIIGILLLPGVKAQEAIPPMPPPTSDVAVAILAPYEHIRKVLTEPTNTTIQAAPNSPLLIYIDTNVSLTITISGETITLNGTGNRRIVKNDLGQGRVRQIGVSARNATITIYAITLAEEVQVAAKQPALDPSRLKRLWAILSATVAVLAGVPLGLWLKQRQVAKKLKKKPYEELRGNGL